MKYFTLVLCTRSWSVSNSSTAIRLASSTQRAGVMMTIWFDIETILDWLVSGLASWPKASRSCWLRDERAENPRSWRANRPVLSFTSCRIHFVSSDRHGICRIFTQPPTSTTQTQWLGRRRSSRTLCGMIRYSTRRTVGYFYNILIRTESVFRPFFILFLLFFFFPAVIWFRSRNITTYFIRARPTAPPPRPVRLPSVRQSVKFYIKG